MFYTYKIDDEISLKEPMVYQAEELGAGISADYDYLREFCPAPATGNTLETARSLIENYCEQNRTLQGLYSLIIYQKQIAGVFQFNRFDFLNSTTEIGYWIFSKYQGKGLISRCCKSMLEYTFEELNFNRVEVKCAIANKKSQAIPRKFGFVEEGVLRQNEKLNGKFTDSILFSLLKEEWEKNKNTL